MYTKNKREAFFAHEPDSLFTGILSKSINIAQYNMTTEITLPAMPLRH
jgi:hypothetical protein